VITLTALHPLVLKQHFVLFSLLQQFLVGILCTSLDAVCAFISSHLAAGEHIYMKAPLCPVIILAKAVACL